MVDIARHDSARFLRDVRYLQYIEEVNYCVLPFLLAGDSSSVAGFASASRFTPFCSCSVLEATASHKLHHTRLCTQGRYLGGRLAERELRSSINHTPCHGTPQIRRAQTYRV